jgi:TRAP transporter TAXI family solute receptor
MPQWSDTTRPVPCTPVILPHETQQETTMTTTHTRIAGLLAGLLLSLGASAQNISIATGGTGGVYYPMGGGLAAVLSKHVPGMQATAEVTGGSVDNLKLIATGKPYVGFSMTDAAQDALRGEDKFKSGKVPLKTLMVLYPTACTWSAWKGAASPRWPTSRASASPPARPAAPPR